MDLRAKVKKAFEFVDSLWMQRKRKVNTQVILSTIHQSAITQRGIGHVLDLNNCDLSAAAICKARSKLPEGIFGHYKSDTPERYFYQQEESDRS